MAFGAFGNMYSDTATTSAPIHPLIEIFAKGTRPEIKAGVGDMKVSNNPEAILSTYSLGSCIGLAVYDPVGRVGGILHYQLPWSSVVSEGRALQAHRFADTGIPALFKACSRLGADPRRMVLKAAGGSGKVGGSSLFNIGARNIDALKKIFFRMGMSLRALDLGGSCSRTMWLDLSDGKLTLKVNGAGDPCWKTL